MRTPTRLMLNLIAAWMILGIATTTVSAEDDDGAFLTGNQLHRFCSGEYAVEQAGCLSYMRGLYDGLLFDYVLEISAGGFAYSTICLLTNHELYADVEISQMFDVVTAYLEEHPETRHRAAPDLVITALNEAWPCS